MPTTEQRIDFTAPEYDADGSFETVSYAFVGSTDAGWDILRNGRQSLALGPGYVPVRSRFCGVCSTDLARRFLPYPLPQIIGHEVVGTVDGRDVAVEINASHLARRDPLADTCPFCHGGIDTQCPDRITLGIDRLPGGFAPYFLAPVNAIVPLPPGLDAETAVLTEPFAAALQAVDSLPLKAVNTIAVLGPRRLGMLLVAALSAMRRREKQDFRIAALGRHDALLSLAGRLGADELVRTDLTPNNSYDVVFDTTGSVDGFALALSCARRILHLKSTNGQPIMGFAHLTDMVVHEIALLPATADSLNFGWPREAVPRTNANIFVAPGVSEHALATLQRAAPERSFHRLDVSDALAALDGGGFPGSPLPRFDLGIASSPKEVDSILRPHREREVSLVRPRGGILLVPSASGQSAQGGGADAPLWDAIVERGLELHSSRCGDFRRATALLAEDPLIAGILRRELITQHYPLASIEEAFSVAADSKRSIKVVVDTASSG